MNAFKSSDTYTISEAGSFDVSILGTFKLLSVAMALDAEMLNTFSIDLIRGGLTWRLYSPLADTYTTIVWLLEGGGIVLVPGDTLTFTNTAAVKGRVFFSYELSGEQGPTITVTSGAGADGVDGAAGPHV